MRQPKFRIGDRVYHVTPESPAGIVTDCKYSLRYNEWGYDVTFDYLHESLTYYEDELTLEKVIV